MSKPPKDAIRISPFTGLPYPKSRYARYRWDTEEPAEADASKETTEIPVACPCSAHKYAHYHSLKQRRKAVRDWNQHSSYKLEEPKS